MGPPRASLQGPSCLHWIPPLQGSPEPSAAPRRKGRKGKGKRKRKGKKKRNKEVVEQDEASVVGSQVENVLNPSQLTQ